MSNIGLEFPPGFEGYEWEVEAKGWLPGVVAVIQGRRYTVTLYDAARLTQDVDAALKGGGVFLERNLVVVTSITRGNVAAAIHEIVRAGRVGDLLPDES